MKHKSDLLPALFLLSFLVIAGGLAMVLPQPPEPLAATAAPSEFSAERAYRYVEVLGREVHPIGYAAHARVRETIVRQLEELGLVAEIQETTVVDPQAILAADRPPANPYNRLTRQWWSSHSAGRA
jgi:hypothetical protein